MTSELWTAYEAAAATGGVLCARGGTADFAADLPEECWAAKGVSIDTRTLRPGEIFVALKDVRDGHDFVEQAFGAGAAAALVSRAPDNTPDGAPLLLVQDTLAGLSALAAAARDRCFGKLIAVTGSAGKTSTKEMLRAALAPSGEVHAADKSFNNHLGVPLTLAALPSSADYGVFEIGMNHAGEITPLTNLVRPHIAIVTTVAAAHLEFFDSVADIAEAKAEIFSGLRRNGIAILLIDNPHFQLLKKRAEEKSAQIITFGEDPAADYRLVSYNPEATGAVVTAALPDGDVQIRFGLTGKHQAMNMLAVLAAVDAAGASRASAMEALGQLASVQGRGRTEEIPVQGGIVTLIDEAYNANPASMAAAISTLAALSDGRKIAVLGEMRELGETSADLHLALVEQLVAAGINRVHAAGTLMKPVIEALPEHMQGNWAENAIDLTDAVMSELKAGDVIMAKGSNASRVAAFVTKLQEQLKARGAA